MFIVALKKTELGPHGATRTTMDGWFHAGFLIYAFKYAEFSLQLVLF